ncbi:MAG: helix-turn-helix domain-containing protein [Huintestinicola sp.]
MIVSIGEPAPKALSANEKRVYRLLREGKAPLEISRMLHIPMGSIRDFSINAHDVPLETIVNIISSIRSKGYEIPEIKKEEEPMAKITEEMKREMITLRNSGMKVNKIAEKFGFGKSSVFNVIKAYSEQGERAFTAPDSDEEPETIKCEAETEKEPAAEATVTDSEQEIFNYIPATIVSPSEENVKTLHEFSPMAAEAVWAKIEELRKEAAELIHTEMAFERMISDINENIRCVSEQLSHVEAEIDMLAEDYEALTGGAAV